MPFIGNQPALSYTSFAVQHFTTSATTSYTLDYSVANENEIRLVINNVVQQPGSSYAYTASGTTLTLSAATSATDTMYAVFLGKAVQTVTPASGSVTNAMLAGNIDLTSKVTGTLPVANGGTGVTTASALANTGNLVLLNTVTTTDATTTNIDFDSTYINSTYDNYYVIANIKSVTDSTTCRLRFSNSGTFQTGASYYGIGKLDDGGGFTNDNDIGHILLTANNIGNASTEGGSFVLNLNALPSTTSPSTAMWNSSIRNNSGFHGLNIGSGVANNVDEHDGIRFYLSSGNFASGTSITLYGVKS